MTARTQELDEARDVLEQRPWAAFAAVALHGWFTALEACLERIVRVVDGELPQGERWHRELLSQATIEIPNIRPVILPRSLLPELYALLAFRHFFRHAYAVAIDPDKLAHHLERVTRIRSQVDAALDAFDEHLAETIATLASDP